MGLSERLACAVVGQNRATQRRDPAGATPADPDAALRTWLRANAKAHPRWGFRRAYHDARGEGWIVNHKKLQRVWREEGLNVPVNAGSLVIEASLPTRARALSVVRAGDRRIASGARRPAPRSVVFNRSLPGWLTR